jgi:hypothetical protein
MGTMIHLSAGNLDIDWGKNNHFFDHSPMYQIADVTDIPSWFVKDHENNDDNWTLYADYNEGYASPLWKVIERLNLLGYTINVAQKQYNLDIEENTYEGSPPIPSFEMLKELFTSCNVSLLVDDERQINRRLDKDFIQHLLSLLKEEDKECTEHLSQIIEGEYERIPPYTFLQLLALNPNASNIPVRWDFNGLVDSGWASRDEFVKPLAQPNRFLIVTEGSSDAAIIRHAFSILRPHIQDFFSYVDMNEGYPFTGTGNLVNFVKGLISIGVQNNVIVLFDNDAEGMVSYTRCNEMNIPYNMRILKLPDLPQFEDFDTVGPNGTHRANINGKAAAIECYLDVGCKAVVRWSNFNTIQQTYHGALIAKDDYKKSFLKQQRKISGYDYLKLNAVLNLITVTAIDIKEKPILVNN